jgi:signal transduction histidine kinase
MVDVQRRHAVLLAFAAVSVVLALLTVFALELSNTQAKSRDDVTARVHERAVLAAALIDSLFQAVGQQVPADARTYGAKVVSNRVMEANRAQSLYLALLDASGRVLATSHGFTAQARADLARSAALRLIRSGRPYALGDVLPYGRQGVIDLAVALPTRSGRRILLTGFAPSAIASFLGGELRKIPGVRGAHNYLVDGRRSVIASTDPTRPSGHVFDDPAEITALARPSGSVQGRYYDQARISNTTWRVVLAAPDGPLFASVTGLRKWIPWAIFMAFAIVAAAAFLLGRRALRAADEVRDSNAQLELVNSELAATNATLARRAAELARSNEELEQFASIASHDLQEPLRKVRTFTQQLTVTEAENLSEKGREYLERANAAAERMQKLIEDLLRFSRVSTHARPFAVVDLGVIAREVLEDLDYEIERAGAVVSVGDLPSVNGDAMQLRQLLQNLVSNALKFRREGVVAEVAIDASVSDEIATISVRDNGIGFEAQYSRRIFRVFERLHGRGAYPGTGIGLALCRKIVERHGGSIVADGDPDAGSTFTVTLPIDQHEEVIAVNAPDDSAATRHREEDRVHA